MKSSDSLVFSWTWTFLRAGAGGRGGEKFIQMRCCLLELVGLAELINPVRLFPDNSMISWRRTCFTCSTVVIMSHCDWLSCFRVMQTVMSLADSVIINCHTLRSTVYLLHPALGTLCCLFVNAQNFALFLHDYNRETKYQKSGSRFQK